MSLASLRSGLRDLQIDTFEVFEPLLANTMPDGRPVRWKGAHGGRGSGKSEFFAGLAVEEAICAGTPTGFNRVAVGGGYRMICAREIQRSLEQSVKQTLVSVMNRHDVTSYFDVQYNKIRTPGDGVIIFEGLQDHTSDSVKSYQDFDRLWMEEAHAISQRSLDLAGPTLRRKGSQIWASWNPETPPSETRNDPVDKLLRYGDRQELRALVVEANFDHNPFFADLPLAGDEAYDRKHRSPEDYAHIWRGAYLIRSEKRVFKNWRVKDFETPAGIIPRFGADFGFSIDPSVLIRCWVGRWVGDPNEPHSYPVPDENGRDLFIDAEAYRVGCDVDHTPALFAGTDTNSPPRWQNPYGDPGIPGALRYTITADSARPETISYLRRHGFVKIQPARKGPGSVEEGIEFLKAFTIWIHPRCTHTADEFTYYSFKTDPKTGNVLPDLEDKKNHVIDAARYAVEDMRKPKGFFS